MSNERMTILSREALRCAAAWRAWIDNPDQNPPPNPRASTARLRAYKAHAAECEYKVYLANAAGRGTGRRKETT